MTSRIKRFFKKAFSFITRKPISLGYGLSIDGTTFDKEPPPRKAKNLVFFKLRKDLGSFEIGRVYNGKDGGIHYRIDHSASDRSFTIPRSLFELLFEEIETKNDDWQHSLPPNTVGKS